MKGKILGLLKDKNLVSGILSSIREPVTDRIDKGSNERRGTARNDSNHLNVEDNKRGSRKNSRHGKSKSRDNSFDGDDEDNGRVFSELVVDDYKRELKIQNKRALQTNFDYRVKLQALAKLQKHVS